jgi:hypothetical protein
VLRIQVPVAKGGGYVLTTGYESLERETIIKRGQEGEISQHSVQLATSIEGWPNKVKDKTNIKLKF